MCIVCMMQDNMVLRMTIEILLNAIGKMEDYELAELNEIMENMDEIEFEVISSDELEQLRSFINNVDTDIKPTDENLSNIFDIWKGGECNGQV